MFLTDDDLVRLTGYLRPAAIRRWLDAHGYKYEIARNGWPRVLKCAVEARLGAVSNREPRLNLA